MSEMVGLRVNPGGYMVCRVADPAKNPPGGRTSPIDRASAGRRSTEDATRDVSCLDCKQEICYNGGLVL